MICIDGKKVKKCFLGDEAIGKVYLGDDLIFQKASRLPAGYTELQYIENPNGAFINMTGYVQSTISISWEIVFELIDTSQFIYFLGNNTNYLSFQNGAIIFNNKTSYGGGYNSFPLSSLAEKYVFSFDYSTKLATLNGSSQTAKLYGSNNTNLFAIGSNYANPANISNFRLYSIKTASNEFVPVRNENDGKVGLFNLSWYLSTGEAFALYSRNSKNFVAGPAA